jgi:hypothetical protein
LSNAPIALFVYNRPKHATQTVEALKKNVLATQSDLVVFSDAPKSEMQIDSVRELREYIHQIDGFKSVSIVEREENFGLAKSIIDGVTSIVNKYGRIIVLEDDLVTSPYFLQYMNDGLRVYEQKEEVASIHGYVYPIDGLPETFFLRGADCWGWATWKGRWSCFEPDGEKLLAELKRKKLTNHFDFNGTYPFTQMLADQIAGKNNSWAIRWHASAFLKNKLTLYPGKSLVLNIGNDGSGMHCGDTNAFSSDVATAPVLVATIPVAESDGAFKAFEQFFRNMTGLVARARRIVGNVVRACWKIKKDIS